MPRRHRSAPSSPTLRSERLVASRSAPRFGAGVRSPTARRRWSRRPWPRGTRSGARSRRSPRARRPTSASRPTCAPSCARSPRRRVHPLPCSCSARSPSRACSPRPIPASARSAAHHAWRAVPRHRSGARWRRRVVDGPHLPRTRPKADDMIAAALGAIASGLVLAAGRLLRPPPASRATCSASRTPPVERRSRPRRWPPPRAAAVRRSWRPTSAAEIASGLALAVRAGLTPVLALLAIAQGTPGPLGTAVVEMQRRWRAGTSLHRRARRARRGSGRAARARRPCPARRRARRHAARTRARGGGPIVARRPA